MNILFISHNLIADYEYWNSHGVMAELEANEMFWSHTTGCGAGLIPDGAAILYQYMGSMKI